MIVSSLRRNILARVWLEVVRDEVVEVELNLVSEGKVAATVPGLFTLLGKFVVPQAAVCCYCNR